MIWHRYLKPFPKKDQDLHIPQSQYHGCWCPGDVRSQGISSHDIDLVKLRLLGPRTLRVKWSFPLQNILTFCSNMTRTSPLFGTTLSIMSLGRRSAIQCNWLSWLNWDRTTDPTAPCVCSVTEMLNIKHPYQMHPYERSGDCPESYQLHFIIM